MPVHSSNKWDIFYLLSLIYPYNCCMPSAIKEKIFDFQEGHRKKGQQGKNAKRQSKAERRQE